MTYTFNYRSTERIVGKQGHQNIMFFNVSRIVYLCIAASLTFSYLNRFILSPRNNFIIIGISLSPGRAHEALEPGIDNM